MKFSHYLWLCVIISWTTQTLQGKEVAIHSSDIGKPSNEKLFVVSIGVSTYQDTFWPNLKWSTRDAVQVAHKVGIATKYQKVAFTLLDQKATLDSVNKTLDAIKSQAQPSDALLIYLSAHGTLNLDHSGQLEKVTVLHNTQYTNLRQTGLRHRDLLAKINAISASKKVVLLATCHSGIGKSKIPPEVQDLLSSYKGHLEEIQEVSEGLLILSASTKGETAREDDSLQSDIYTYYFLEGLEKNDRNQNGSTSAMEAHDYAKIKTYAHSRGRQRPTAQARFIGEGDLVLRGQPAKANLPLIKGYKKDYDGLWLKINGREKGPLPLSFPLKEGVNQISVYLPNEEDKAQHYEIEVKDQEEVDLADLLAKPPYLVGVYTGLTKSLSKVSQKIQNADYQRTNGIFASYGTEAIRLGLHHELQESQDNQTPILPGLKIDFSLQNNYLSLGSNLHSTGPFIPSISVLLGQQQARIHMYQGTYDLSYTSKSLLFGVQSSYSYEFNQDFHIGLFVHYKRANHDFEHIGKLNHHEAGMGLSLNHSFGRKARPL